MVDWEIWEKPSLIKTGRFHALYPWWPTNQLSIWNDAEFSSQMDSFRNKPKASATLEPECAGLDLTDESRKEGHCMAVKLRFLCLYGVEFGSGNLSRRVRPFCDV
jgi:hypothetical protein